MEPLVTVNTTELARFKVIADRFDKSVTRGVRKSIRKIGEGATTGVKKTLRLPAPSDGEGGPGSREALAGGTRVTVSFSQRSAGAKIVTSGARLAHKGFAAAYDMPSFRHPVYGNKSAWVNQEGRPYFGSVITEYLDGPKAKKELEAVLDDAVKAIGGRG
jgi:hypothetical protein